MRDEFTQNIYNGMSREDQLIVDLRESFYIQLIELMKPTGSIRDVYTGIKILFDTKDYKSKFRINDYIVLAPVVMRKLDLPVPAESPNPMLAIPLIISNPKDCDCDGVLKFTFEGLVKRELDMNCRRLLRQLGHLTEKGLKKEFREHGFHID